MVEALSMGILYRSNPAKGGVQKEAGRTRLDWMLKIQAPSGLLTKVMTGCVMPRRKLFTRSSMITMLKRSLTGIGIFYAIIFECGGQGDWSCRHTVSRCA
jgi:hypothetical protein